MDTLYHYTDLNAFLSIIQNKKLWLTGAYNLNDHREVTWALEKIGTCLSRFATSHCQEKANEISQLIQASCGVPYICSLSTESDRLSQWRAYGQNGAGIAIGINRSALPSSERLPYMTASRKQSVSLQRVVYDNGEQEQLIDQVLAPIFDLPKIDEEAHFQMSMAASKLSGLSTIFKNRAFSEESEWRIIHRPMIMGRHDDNASLIRMSISEAKFRVAGQKIVTYFEFDFFDKAHSEIFAEVMLGPRCEVSNYDLSILLTQHGLEKIRIRRSEASYR